MSRREEFAEFVRGRSPALQRAAYLMVGEVPLAQDLVQEALVKTYVAWPRLRDPGNAEAYCRKVITTTAITWFRRRSWQERPVDLTDRPGSAAHDPDAPDLATATVQSQWLWEGLQQLPPRQRAAIVLRYYEDLSEAQTAQAMDCAVGTVKSQVSAGIGKLRDLLGHEDPENRSVICLNELLEDVMTR